MKNSKKMQNEIEEIKDGHKICLYKKEKDNTMKENRQFLFDIKNILQDQLPRTKEKVENDENNFKEKYDLLKKNMVDVYGSSVISSKKSGIPNVCSRVRRLFKYSLEKSKYFKTESLYMIVSQSINLTGFALCCLF